MLMWVGIIFAFLLPQQSQEPPRLDDAAALVGVWEGIPERIAAGGCQTSGTLRPMPIEISVKPDGVLVGDVTDLPLDRNWTGRIVNGQVVFDVPRDGECNGTERKYVLTLRGAMPVTKGDVKTLTLAGTEEPCPVLQCRFGYTVVLKWKRALETPK
jgi:hypothetical protein